MGRRRQSNVLTPVGLHCRPYRSAVDRSSGGRQFTFGTVRLPPPSTRGVRTLRLGSRVISHAEVIEVLRQWIRG